MWVVNFKKKRIMKKLLVVLLFTVLSCSEKSEQIEQDIDCGCKEIGYDIIVDTCNGGMNLCSRNINRLFAIHVVMCCAGLKPKT